LESREEVFKSLENEPSTRYDDQLDLIEANILGWSDIRVEYRWNEIERLRTLINWYPFYPQIVLGESSDDCADPDRLISFEDDLSTILFDLNAVTADADPTVKENLKFKLLCKFLKTLNLISWNEESLTLKEETCAFNLINSAKLLENNEDIEYARYLNEQLDYLNDDKSIDRHDLPFCGNFNFLNNLFSNFFDPYESNSFRSYSQSDLSDLKSIFKSLIQNTVDFVRNCFAQASLGFESLEFRTNVLVLEWKFELGLINLVKKWSPIEKDPYFDSKILKQNLLEKAKQSLSLEHNRANFALWKQYGILKWLLGYQSNPTNQVSTF
jgi:hypothetical protein